MKLWPMVYVITFIHQKCGRQTDNLTNLNRPFLCFTYLAF